MQATVRLFNGLLTLSQFAFRIDRRCSALHPMPRASPRHVCRSGARPPNRCAFYLRAPGNVQQISRCLVARLQHSRHRPDAKRASKKPCRYVHRPTRFETCGLSVHLRSGHAGQFAVVSRDVTAQDYEASAFSTPRSHAARTAADLR